MTILYLHEIIFQYIYFYVLFLFFWYVERLLGSRVWLSPIWLSPMHLGRPIFLSGHHNVLLVAHLGLPLRLQTRCGGGAPKAERISIFFSVNRDCWWHMVLVMGSRACKIGLLRVSFFLLPPFTWWKFPFAFSIYMWIVFWFELLSCHCDLSFSSMAYLHFSVLYAC